MTLRATILLTGVVVVFAGCGGDENSSNGGNSAGATGLGGMGTTTGTTTTGTTTTGSGGAGTMTTTASGGANTGAVPGGGASSGGTSSGGASTGGTDSGGTSSGGGTGGDDNMSVGCDLDEVITDFDEAIGVVATDGGTSPESLESVTPSFENGLATFEIPFTAPNEQYGWNVEFDDTSDGSGRELVVVARLVSGFNPDPEAPGGMQLYGFSDSWSASLGNWTNIVGNDAVEYVLDLDADDEDFDPTNMNAVGFTFHTGGATEESATAVFEVDCIGFRDKETDLDASMDPDLVGDDPDAGVDAGD